MIGLLDLYYYLRQVHFLKALSGLEILYYRIPSSHQVTTVIYVLHSDFCFINRSVALGIYCSSLSGCPARDMRKTPDITERYRLTANG